MEVIMPLDKSGSKKSVGKNIATEEASGKSREQSIAIALETQRRAGVKPKDKGMVTGPAGKKITVGS